MKVFIDTNIFISAILLPNSITARAYINAINLPYEPITSQYVVDELREKFNEKFPDHITALEEFLSYTLNTIRVVNNHKQGISPSNDTIIRDVKDQPILDSAIEADVDYILTGDKDFLELMLERPVCIKPADFLNLTE